MCNYTVSRLLPVILSLMSNAVSLASNWTQSCQAASFFSIIRRQRKAKDLTMANKVTEKKTRRTNGCVGPKGLRHRK